MTSRKAAALKMYLAVEKVCDAHQTAYTTLPAFNNGYTKFKALIANINGSNTNLQGKITGITDDKLAKRQAMADATIVVASALVAYAHSIDNHTLADDADVNDTEIMRCKETDADDICLHIHDLANDHLAALADFGITQADLDILAASIDDFTGKIGNPRNHIINTKTTRGNMNGYFTAADELLTKQLDNLIVVLKKKYPDFYTEYLLARNIIEQGGSAAKVAEKVVG